MSGDDDDVIRLLGDPPDGAADLEQAVPLRVWLTHLEVERDALIMRLRQIDRELIRHGRLNGETIPRRSR